MAKPVARHSGGLAPKAHQDPARGPELPVPLLVWFSPSFPVGAFAYSHGLEKAAELGLLRGRADLEGWIAALFASGSARSDMILLAHAYRAVAAGRWRELSEVADLGLALQPSAERFLEATQQGRSFLVAIEAAWPHAFVSEAGAVLDGEASYPVAVAIAAAAHEVQLVDTLKAYGVAFVSNLVSAAIRLGIIGQTGGQCVLVALLPVIQSTAAAAECATLEDIGTATFRSDICSLQHETQPTRLFRS